MRHFLFLLFAFFSLWSGKCAKGLTLQATTIAFPEAEQARGVLLGITRSEESWTTRSEEKRTANSGEAATAIGSDTLLAPPLLSTSDSLGATSTPAAQNDSLLPPLPLRLKKKDLRKLQLEAFQPNPKRALWLALVIPGAGQIYNRKYWKLPIFYGGFLGCTYAFLWNQQMYRDYSQAYLDITDSDTNTKSYLDFLPPNFQIEGREKQFQTLFKNRRDRYRRYRDMSIFAFVGVYLLSVVDAYVDAQLSQFDISPDLSLRIEPAIIGTPSSLSSPSHRSAYGIGCSLRF